MDCYTGFTAKLKKQILQYIQLSHAQNVLCPLSVWNSIRYCITWLVKGKSFKRYMSLSLCNLLICICSRRRVKKSLGFFLKKKKNLFYSFITRRKNFRLFLGPKSAEIVQSVNINNPFKLHRKLKELPKHQNRQIIHIKFWSALLQSDLNFKARI